MHRVNMQTSHKQSLDHEAIQQPHQEAIKYVKLTLQDLKNIYIHVEMSTQSG